MRTDHHCRVCLTVPVPLRLKSEPDYLYVQNISSGVLNQFSLVSKLHIIFKFIRLMCYTLNYLNIPPSQFYIQDFLSEKTPSDAPRNSNALREQLRHTGCT